MVSLSASRRSSCSISTRPLPAPVPTDPYERALARFWGAYIDDKLLASFLQSARGKTEEEKAEGMKQTLVAVENMEGAFKEISKGKPFFRRHCRVLGRHPWGLGLVGARRREDVWDEAL